MLLSAAVVASLLATTVPSVGRDGSARAAAATGSTTRPNFVLILSDDLDATVTPIWQAMPKTAKILRDRGMSFVNTFVPSPDCCPARTSLLLGSYPHNTGVFASAGDYGGWSAFSRNGDASKTMAVALQSAGYRTALIGKYLNGYESSTAGLTPPPGWDDWNTLINDNIYSGYSYTIDNNGVLEQHGTSAADYSTDVLSRKTAAFLGSAALDPSKPFFAYVAPTAPHYPLPPPPRYATNPWSNATTPALPNFYEPDLSDKPTWLQVSASYRDQWKAKLDTDYRNRMGSLMALDDLVANVANALAANGQLANTYLIFSSDNGYELGAHHIAGKLAPYEESIRVPLVIAGPGISPGKDGHMVVLSDLEPTILQLAGVQPSAPSDMRSLVPLLTGPAPTTWRKDMLVERRLANAPNANPANYYIYSAMLDMPSYEALRTQRYLFVEWYEENELGGKHEYELYDLAADPYELNNLVKTTAGVQQNASTFSALLQRLHALEVCAGTTCQ